jgi:hypothetical protein
MDHRIGMHARKTIAVTAKTAYFEGDTAGLPAQAPESDTNMGPAIGPVLIKQHAGRRNYQPAGRYLALDDIAVMVEDEQDVTVLDSTSRIDITTSILGQIIRKCALHG